MFKSDILLTGYYGKKNTGDDAFVETTAWGAKKIWRKNDFRFLAKPSTLPCTITPVKGYPFELKRTYSLQADLMLNNTDAFIYAGGSTLHSKLAESNIRFKAYNKKLQKSDLKYGAIGVSIGPFATIEDEKAVKNYLRQMDFLAVRDQKSYEIVEDFNLPYKPINAFDLAALLPEVYDYDFKKNKNVQKKIIGISVCPFESVSLHSEIQNEIRRNDMVVGLIKKLDKEADLIFRFYVINGHEKVGDYKLTMETIEKANPKHFEIVPYNKDTKQTWISIASCDFIISTRLHAAIFACFAEVPFMLNEYHRKCTDFLSNIGYFPKYRLFNSEYNIREKADEILDVITEDNFIKPKKTLEMKERARLNFTKIKF